MALSAAAISLEVVTTISTSAFSYLFASAGPSRRNQAGGMVCEVLTFDGPLVREGHGVLRVEDPGTVPPQQRLRQRDQAWRCVGTVSPGAAGITPSLEIEIHARLPHVQRHLILGPWVTQVQPVNGPMPPQPFRGGRPSGRYPKVHNESVTSWRGKARRIYRVTC